MAASAQTGSVKVHKKDSDYADSMKGKGYPWRFPLLGSKVASRGFSLQYPVGAMINFSPGSQKVNISDLKVGIGSHEPVDLDFVKFGEVKAEIQALTARMDLWVLPFLDVYGIAGKVWSKTNVSVVSPIQFNTEANFDGHVLGLGVTLAGGYHGFVSINDFNHTWTILDNIEGAVKTWMITPRLGYNFNFPKDRMLTFWVGTTGLLVDKGTAGSINIGNLTEDIPQDKLQEIKDETASWYQGLSRPQQIVVKDIADKLIDKIETNNPDGVIINYSLRKRPVSNWSMLVGGQYQFSKRWQARVEVGFLGGRQSGLLSANYRWRW
ncbi:hypothetical protein [Chitinophaga barathri]|nr:hypothetical protein [Chitinophaga barathri]